MLTCNLIMLHVKIVNIIMLYVDIIYLACRAQKHATITSYFKSQFSLKRRFLKKYTDFTLFKI